MKFKWTSFLFFFVLMKSMNIIIIIIQWWADRVSKAFSAGLNTIRITDLSLNHFNIFFSMNEY